MSEPQDSLPQQQPPSPYFSPPSSSPPSSLPPAPRPPASGAHWLSAAICWTVILGCVAFVVIRVNSAVMARSHRERAAATQPATHPATQRATHLAAHPAADGAQDNLDLRLISRVAVGAKASLPAQNANDALAMLKQVDDAARSRDDRIRAAVVAGEVGGASEALLRLDRIDSTPAADHATSAPSDERAAATLPADHATSAPSDEGAAATLPADHAASEPSNERAAATLPADHDAPAENAPAEADPTIEALRTIYTRSPADLSPAQRDAIVKDLGWFGRLALAFGAPQDDPQRSDVLHAARRTFIGLAVVLVVAIGLLLLGLALLITAIVMFSTGTLRRLFVPVPGSRVETGSPPAVGHGVAPENAAGALTGPGALSGPFAPQAQPSAFQTASTSNPFAPAPQPAWARTSIAEPSSRPPAFLEAFALYIAGFIAFSALLQLLVKDPPLLYSTIFAAVLPVALLWPVLRGFSWRESLAGYGWHRGRGVLIEILAGVGGYIAGLPLVAIAFLIAMRLGKLAGVRPTHPAVEYFSRGGWQLAALYFIACVWAPVMEETMFRGALYNHLRSRRWNWLLSAATVGLIFAAIHPQGWTLIPVLGAIGAVLAMIREWRGSLIGSITAHALSNGLVVTLGVTLLGK